MLTIDIFDAFHGDCLLLRWGGRDDYGHLLVDGGPPRTWPEVLKSRFAALAAQLNTDSFPIDLCIVTHIDDDHIGGILAMAEALESAQSSAVLLDVVWLNDLSTLVPDIRPDVGTATLVSIAQSRRLTALLTGPLGVTINRGGLDGLIRRGVALPLEQGPTLTVLGPTPQQIAALRRKWQRATTGGKGGARTAETVDGAVENLSSIITLVEHDGKSVLLTGDARSDHILDGLQSLDRLGPGDQYAFDVVKLPHHGSIRSINKAFFEKVLAKNYIVQGNPNGKHPNPDPETIRHLLAARPNNDFVIYASSAAVRDLILNTAGGRPVEVRCPAAGETVVSLALV